MSKKGTCWLCKKEVDEEMLCGGCDKYFCNDCDPGDDYSPMGNHEPIAHQLAQSDREDGE